MASKLYGSSQNWAMRRRGVDFYDEGELIWLDADTLIRQKTGRQEVARRLLPRLPRRRLRRPRARRLEADGRPVHRG